MQVSAFDFTLPQELIAQRPARPRDSARLLHVGQDGLNDRHVTDLPDLVDPGDLLIFNDTRVLPARLFGRRGMAGVEVTLHQLVDEYRWRVFARPARKCRLGDLITFAEGLEAEVVERGDHGEIMLRFSCGGQELIEQLRQHGQMPLPPYIARSKDRDAADDDDYQTMFAKRDGAVAAPTASLHFTERLLSALKERQVEHSFVTLHVGAGTFLPVRAETTDGHRMHAECYQVGAETVEAIEKARRRGGRIIACGTTVLRTLEAAAGEDGKLRIRTGETRLFITPGYRFRLVDRLLTNFHLPRSTLFMLVAAFSGLERMQSAYEHAIAQRYRFLFLWRCLSSRSPTCNHGECVMTGFSFDLLANDGRARLGRVNTAHGPIDTPTFMPVGTAATVKAMTADMVRATGAQVVLGNTYHLMLRPSAERVARLGGLHKFMDWPGPILTDSGGFQVMSLQGLRHIRRSCGHLCLPS